jgi:hypothetical protein
MHAFSMQHFVKERRGLLAIIAVLVVVTITSIKPGFYLMGWDNYSSYFNLKTNIFRTLFATWRDYRGLGAPSDAEVTDLFRQLFFFLMNPIVPEQLLDQAYYLLALWLGVLGMYFLTGTVFKQRKDVVGCIAGFFYLFNLNTLSVFYSPIIPFTNRFWAVPILLYLALRFWQSKRTAWNFFILALVSIVASGSFLTPTVMITSLVAFFLFAAFHQGIRRAFLSCAVYLALNSFWVLPFLNYTIQKSSIMPLARTFIEINESTLNAPASAFSLLKQGVLTPSFFDLQFKTIDGGVLPVHPQLTELTKPPLVYILFLFPVLYTIGVIVMIAQWKKNKHLLWIPAWIVLFLFLSMKEFGPMGWLYTLFTDRIPLFGIIFRISDTKFHAYISVAGCLAAAYAVVWLLSVWHTVAIQRVAAGGFVILAFSYVWLFRGYISGNLIGQLAFTRLSNAYKQIAAGINAASGDGRVLHLPMDQWHSYWRSFSWGYVGSSFFHYLINKPYIDKTFEPASMENAYLHEHINRLIDAFYRSNDPEKRVVLAQQFLQLLRVTGIQYVLLDESITSSVYPKNLSFGAKQYYVQSHAIIDYLVRAQKGIVRRGAFTVDRPTIEVFEILDVTPTVRTVTSLQNIDSGIADSFSLAVAEKDSEIITQNPDQPAALFPFRQQKHTVVKSDASLMLRYDNPNPQIHTYRVRVPPSDVDSYMIDIYAKLSGDRMTLTFFHRYLPDMNGQRFVYRLGSVTILFPKKTVDMRLMVNDVFFSLPAMRSGEEISLGSFMLHEKTIRAALLEEVSVVPVELSSFRETQPLSCFGAPATTYDGKTTAEKDFLQLTARSGSACVRGQFTVPTSARVYAELEATFAGSDGAEAFLCMREGAIDDCLNSRRVIRIRSGQASPRIALRSLVTGGASHTMDIGVISPTQDQQTIDLGDLRLRLYEAKSEKTLAFVPFVATETITIAGDLEVSFSKAASSYSYFHDPQSDGFYVPLDSCRGERPLPRDIRYRGDTVVSRMTNCSTHVAQWFRYAPDRPYLFAYSYGRMSGQQPSMVMGRNGDNFLFERASIWQGYPNLPKGLVSASRLIDPLFYTDSAPADTAIHLFQDTANTGIMEVGDFDIMEYPAAWRDLSLTPEGSQQTYTARSETATAAQILPSLWKVSIAVPAGGMIAFNRGFDRQWGIYDSLAGVLFGKSLASSVRCDGYANCFALPAHAGSRTYYLFYAPERLSLLGWLVTGATIATCLIVLRRLRTRSS